MRYPPQASCRARCGREFELVAEVVTDAIRRFPEVTETNTHIAFRAHGRPEVEAAFSLGDG